MDDADAAYESLKWAKEMYHKDSNNNNNNNKNNNNNNIFSATN